jgi:hypothetical protein
MMRDVNRDFTLVGTPTDAPKVGPTMPPAFNLHDFARDSGGLIVSSDTVLETVSDLSWSAAGLDLVEMNVIRQIDGVSPVCMIESAVAMSRDELQVMFAMLMARGLVRVVREERYDSEPVSGVFRTAGAEDVEELFANVG